MKRSDMQKVADALGLIVYHLANGQCVTNPVGLTVVETVYPKSHPATAEGSHGLGDNIPHEYATPAGAGGKL